MRPVDHDPIMDSMLRILVHAIVPHREVVLKSVLLTGAGTLVLFVLNTLEFTSPAPATYSMIGMFLVAQVFSRCMATSTSNEAAVYTGAGRVANRFVDWMLKAARAPARGAGQDPQWAHRAFRLARAFLFASHEGMGEARAAFVNFVYTTPEQEVDAGFGDAIDSYYMTRAVAEPRANRIELQRVMIYNGCILQPLAMVGMGYGVVAILGAMNVMILSVVHTYLAMSDPASPEDKIFLQGAVLRQRVEDILARADPSADPLGTK